MFALDTDDTEGCFTSNYQALLCKGVDILSSSAHGFIQRARSIMLHIHYHVAMGYSFYVVEGDILGGKKEYTFTNLNT